MPILITQGSQIKGACVETGATFLKKHYKKDDKVITYGYSYGGDNVVNTADKVESTVNIDLMVIVNSSDGLGKGITVNTTIPNNVKITYNFHQEGYSGRWGTSIGSSGSGSLSGSSSGFSDSSGSGSDSSETSNFPGSKGHPRFTSKKATVVNERINVKGVTHGNIQMKAKEEILSPMKKVIDSL